MGAFEEESAKAAIQAAPAAPLTTIWHVEGHLRLCKSGCYPHAVLSFPSSAGGGEVRSALAYEAMRRRLSWTEMRGSLAFRA